MRRFFVAATCAAAVGGVVVPALAAPGNGSGSGNVGEHAAARPIVFDPHPVRPARYPMPVAQPFALSATTSTGLPGALDADGPVIRGHIWNPDTSAEPDWPKPVIVVMGPNFDNPVETASAGVVLKPHDTTARTHDTEAGQAYFDFMTEQVRRGYTVVEADMRGTGASGGCFDFWGPGSAADFRRVVDYARSYDGHRHDVGAFGGSAEGLQVVNGWHGAGLKTAVVAQAVTRLYDLIGHDGVPFDSPANEVVYWGFGHLPTGDANSIEAARPGCPPEPDDHLDFTGTITPYWQARDHRAVSDVPNTSLFYVGGLHEHTIIARNLDDWYDDLPSFKRAILGHWDHGPFHDSAAFGSYDRDDLYNSIEAWFDQMLGGVDTGVASWPAVQVQSDDKTWRAVPTLAGMTASVTDLALGVSDLGVHTLGRAGRPGSTVAFGGNDVETWLGDLRTSPLHLAGEATAELPVTFDQQTSGRVEIDLYSVDTAGRKTALARAYRAADHVDDLTQPNDVPAGSERTLRFRTPYFDATIPVGSRLELDLRTLPNLDNPGGEAQMVPSPPFTAQLHADAAVLHLPLAADICGVTVVQTPAGSQPTGATLGCPDPNGVR